MDADALSIPAGDALALSRAQAQALSRVRGVAERDRPDATERAGAVLARAGIEVDVEQLCARVPVLGRVAVNFHPDRIAVDGRTVVQALLVDGLYRNQFETLISNGGLGAVRDGFEERLFAGAYSQTGVAPFERPRYGGLDLVRHPDGPCPRFGSCHLRLRPEALRRCTFSFGDSVTEPTAVATIEVFHPVLAALLEAAEAGRHGSVIAVCDTVLGLPAPNVDALVRLLLDGPATGSRPGRALDDYIEAQVHGPVRLQDDIEALVADPSFRDSEIGSQLQEMAQRFVMRGRLGAGGAMSAASSRAPGSKCCCAPAG